MINLPINTKTAVLLNEGKCQERKKIGSVSCQRRDFSSFDNAAQAFPKISRKLFDVDEWNRHCSKLISFELFDPHGNISSEKQIREDYFLRVYMKGSGSYDWVKFTEIFQSPDELILKVKPTFDPTAEVEKQKSTAHFLIAESANHFCLLKAENSLHLCVIGLNEKQNTSETNNFLAAIRNFATANIGYYLGIQKSQWKLFCRRFLDSVD